MRSNFVTRTHLRRALNLSTTSQDNHLRALVLSLIASHYLHTSNQHAKKMLETAENLAAGLGTQPRSSKAHAPPTQPTATTVAVADTVGNAHLRLWIGERFLGMMISIYLFPCWLFLNLIELYNRTGDKEAAKVQTFKNTNFMEAVARVEARGWNYDEIPLFFQCSRDNAIAFVLSAFFWTLLNAFMSHRASIFIC